MAPRQARGRSERWRAEGGPRQTPTPGQCLSPRVEGKTHELVSAAEQIFLLPSPHWSQRLLQPALRAFRAMALSCGWRSARPPSPDGTRAKTAGPRSEGTADVLSLSFEPHHLEDCHGLRIPPPALFLCDSRALRHMKADQVTPWLQPFRGSLLSSGQI